MAAELSFNKKMNIVKMLLSSLFARKQSYLIVDGNNRNVFYMTNIPHARIPVYKADVDDTIAKVTISEEMAQIVYEAFPVFGEVVAEIDITTFMSTVNKRIAKAKVYPEIIVDKERQVLKMWKPNDEADEAVTEEEALLEGDAKPDRIDVVIGTVIPSHLTEIYEGILTKINTFVEQPVEKDVSIPSTFANDKVILSKIELQNDVLGKPCVFKLPLQDGFNVISFKEYLSKKGMPWKYRVLVHYRESQNVARVSVTYSDDWVSAQIACPGALWFPYPK